MNPTNENTIRALLRRLIRPAAACRHKESRAAEKRCRNILFEYHTKSPSFHMFCISYMK